MEYMPSVMRQTVSLVYSAGLGFCFGLVYDLFRIIFYSLTGSDKKLNTVRDIIYVLVCLCAHFLFILVMCSGKVLLFTFAGEGAGLAVYFTTLSRQIFNPLKLVLQKIRACVSSFFSHISGFVAKSKKIPQKIVKMIKKFQKNL